MTIRIKSSHPASQGPFVLIEEADFDPDKHSLFDVPAPAPEPPAPAPSDDAPHKPTPKPHGKAHR